MRTKNISLLIIFLFLLFLSILYFFTFEKSFEERPIFDSPDRNNYYSFAMNYLENNNLFFTPPNLSREDIKIAFTPRDAAYFNGKIVFRGFLGAIFFYITIFSLSTNLVYFINIIFSILILISLFLFLRYIFNIKTATIGIIILGLFPIYWYYSSILLIIDIPFLFFYLFSFYYFFKFLDIKSKRCFILFSIFCAVSISWRYDKILFYFPFLLIFLFYEKNRIFIYLLKFCRKKL